jgi:hypothetical protein
MKAFRNKAPGEAKLVTFPFAAEMAAGSSISSAVVDKEVFSGVDPGVSLVVGVPVISGSNVIVLASGGAEGVTYLLTAKVQADNGETHHRSGRLGVAKSAA